MADPNPEQSFVGNNAKDTAKLKDDRLGFKTKAALFLGGVSVMSALAGFSTTVASVRKREKEILMSAGFDQAKITEMLNHEAGTRLAFRALGWGTVYAVAGVSILCFAFWKITGASNFEEFRITVGHKLPRIPKSENPGRSEFEDFQDFVDYISKDPKDSDS